MKRVETLEEIKQNIFTLDGYLDRKVEPEYSFALSLVKKGTCFIVVKQDGDYRFYPSRFIGYAENTMVTHENAKLNKKADGRKTNLAIEKILNQRESCDAKMEKAYQEYCRKLGFTANDKGTFGVQRKYWRLF